MQEKLWRWRTQISRNSHDIIELRTTWSPRLISISTTSRRDCDRKNSPLSTSMWPVLLKTPASKGCRLWLLRWRAYLVHPITRSRGRTSQKNTRGLVRTEHQSTITRWPHIPWRWAAIILNHGLTGRLCLTGVSKEVRWRLDPSSSLASTSAWRHNFIRTSTRDSMTPSHQLVWEGAHGRCHPRHHLAREPSLVTRNRLGH